ncbi:MAG: dihydropteroate synthase [bacterium]
MTKTFHVRKISKTDLFNTIKEVGFDSSYINKAINKYKFNRYLICDLTPQQATIIKQTALSLGADSAVHREVITCKVDKSNVLIGCTDTQLERIADKLKLQPFKLKQVADELLTVKNNQLIPLVVRNRVFNWSAKTYIMGILNVTPDSFSDGGKFFGLEEALKQAELMINSGVDIIDIGGESTRPFSEEVPPDEELKRILPVIKKLREKYPEIIISVDTRHSHTAIECVQNGADIINDVSGFDKDPQMMETVKNLDVPIIIMHSQGSPETMQNNPEYSENIITSIYKTLSDKVNNAISCGIKKENLIIDPGVGFGKTQEHNIEIIRRIEEFTSLGLPILVGISRKSVIANILNSQDRDDATIALNSYLAQNGANIIRVHKVPAHSKAFKVLDVVIKN